MRNAWAPASCFCLRASCCGGSFGKFIPRQRFLKKLEVARITPEELRERMVAGESLDIVDLRTTLDNEWPQIPGAVRLSLENLTSASSQIPRDREIILYCT